MSLARTAIINNLSPRTQILLASTDTDKLVATCLEVLRMRRASELEVQVALCHELAQRPDARARIPLANEILALPLVVDERDERI